MNETEVYLKRQIDDLRRELDRLKTNVPEAGGVWQDWTPEAVGLTSPSYATQIGKYTQIGNVVIGHFVLRINSWSDQSGMLRITPPPIGTYLIGSGSYYNYVYPKLYARRIEKYSGYLVFLKEDFTNAEDWTTTSLVELKGNFIGEI